jgi:Holliday junction resolvasome RuvABC endonuclease subunit
LIEESKPEVIAYESVLFSKTTITAQIYGGFLAQLQEVLENWKPKKIEYVGIPVTTIKKFATGVGNAGKPLMIQAAMLRWPDFKYETDDEVDARWIAATAAVELGCSEPIPPALPNPVKQERSGKKDTKKR